MTYILKYYFSIAFLLCSFLTFAQSEKTLPLPATVKDSIVPKKERYGLRVGVDVFRLARSVYDKDYKGVEFTGDYRWNRKYYLAAEIGNENKTTDEVQLNFTTKGTYVKFGFDYNTHENWLNLENMIYVGLRYGISTFSQELNSYSVYNPNPYFGENTFVDVSQKYNGLSAQWGEVVAGMKTQVLPNIFVGFSFRMNRMFTNKSPEGFENLYVPGFNRTYDGGFGVGFNYTVSYFVPLYKKKVAEKKKEEAKKK